MGPVSEIMVDGQKAFGREMAFEPLREPWSEYELSDGGILRVRNTIARIYWVCDQLGNVIRHPGGEPYLTVSGQVQLVTRMFPPELGGN